MIKHVGNHPPATDSVVQLGWGESGSVSVLASQETKLHQKNWAKFQVYVLFEHLTGYTDALFT